MLYHAWGLGTYVIMLRARYVTAGTGLGGPGHLPNRLAMRPPKRKYPNRLIPGSDKNYPCLVVHVLA